MHWFCLVLALSFSTPVIAAVKKPISENFLAQFEGLCLKNEKDFEAINSVMEMTPKSKNLTKNQLKSLGLSASKGTGYGYSVNKDLFFVVFDKNSCGMMMQGNDIKKFKNDLTTNFRLKNKQKVTEGYQVIELYEFTEDSIYSGGILSLVYPKDSNKKNVILLNFIPEPFNKGTSSE